MAELLPQRNVMRSKLRLVNTSDRREEVQNGEEREEMFRHFAEEPWEVSCDDERPTGQLEPTRSTSRRRAS
jgi:hypothetical protein